MNFFSGMFNSTNNNNNNQGPNRNPQMSAHQKRLHEKGVATMLDMLPAFPATNFGRIDINKGNKILLPQRLLEEITNKNFGNIPYPMIFQISSLRSKKNFFVGVLEFTAPDDTVILPDWLFRNLKIAESEMIRIGFCKFLPKANFCKIQPHKTAFIDLPDPKTILEIELRNFICLNLNETITIEFNGIPYDLDILEIKPETNYKAAVIIDTDMNLDFAPPKDYVEPIRRKKSTKNNESNMNYEKFKRIDGKNLKKKQKKLLEEEQLAKEFDPRKHKIKNGIRDNCLGIFSSFKGKGISLGRN